MSTVARRYRTTVSAWACCACRSRTTSRSRRSASARSGPTSRTSGTRALCTASSGGAQVRIESRPGGVRVEPLDAETRPGRPQAARRRVRARRLLRWARKDPVLRRLTKALAGFRPPLAPDPFETLVTSITAQQVSLHAAFAIRNRLIERFGRRVGRAYAFPTARRLRRPRTDELVGLGFSNRKAEYVLGLAAAPARPRRALASSRPRGQGAPRRRPRPRRVDRRLVPRPPPRASARVAGRRPRPPQGGGRLLLRRPTTCAPSASASNRSRT